MFEYLKNKKVLIAIAVSLLIVAVVIGLVIYNSYFGAPQANAEPGQVTVPLGSGDFIQLSELLKEKGFIKSETGFKLAYFKTMGIGLTATTCVDCYAPGAYKLSKSMTAWELANMIKKGPYMKWVVIPEGLRKEQIVEILADPLSLNWSEKQKSDWITNFTAMQYDYIEGVYFPETYLIPVDETPLNVANRLRAKFNEKFEPYAKEALAQNIKWDTLLKIASIVQREAAGKDDMPLVAGILWNRLLKGMKLETDATIQYIRDDVIHYGKARFDTQPTTYTSDGDWWTPIKVADMDIASPYNTYRNKGLPPHPISNPGLDAINAVLHSTETECLYYLHDSARQIHCAKTYEDHQQNISAYLKN